MDRERGGEPTKMVDQIKRLLTDRPFVRFRVFVSDGASFAINHPEAAVATKGGLEIVSVVEGGYAFCSWLHISRLEIAFAESPSGHADG